MAYRTLAILLLAVLLTACDRAGIHHSQTYVFGTLVETKIFTADRTAAEQVSKRLFTEFDKMHADWHAWEPSRLTEMNTRLQSGNWFVGDRTLLPLIAASKTYSKKSDGLFNPAIGQLIQLWGFQQNGLPDKPPAHAEIDQALRRLPTMENIEINEDKMRADNPRVQLDLGAIAKGYAMSLAIQQLRSAGITDALVNAGGDLCGIGSKGDSPWRIGIRDPGGNGIIASIGLDQDECVFTSGDYERYFFYNQTRYHHIIDPGTGYPAEKTRSVTVLHNDGTLADAASTALFIAGPDRLIEVAGKLGIDKVMMVDRDNRIIMTPEMSRRTRLEDEQNRDIIITSQQ